MRYGLTFLQYCAYELCHMCNHFPVDVTLSTFCLQPLYLLPKIPLHILFLIKIVEKCFQVLVLILGSSSSDDVRGPSNEIKKSGVKTIAVGTDSSVPVDQLNIIAFGGDAVITTTTIVKINTVLQPVIDKINDSKYYKSLGLFY